MRQLFILLFSLAAFSLSAQTDTTIKRPDANLVSNGQIFPFRFNETAERFDLLINLADPAVKTQYGELFKKHSLRFEGDVWQEVMEQIIEKVDPVIAKEVEYMDGEENIYVGTKNNKLNQQNYLKAMLLVLKNEKIFEGYLKRLDRTRIDDGEEGSAKLPNE